MCHCAVWSADEFVINFYCCKENQYTLFRIYYVMLITWRYNHNPTTFCISHLIAQVITVEYKCRLQYVQWWGIHMLCLGCACILAGLGPALPEAHVWGCGATIFHLEGQSYCTLVQFSCQAIGINQSFAF